MKIMITGSTGFVGRHLSQSLLDEGHEVTGLGFHHRPIRHERFHFIQADTTRPGTWQESLTEMDAVVNLAGANIFKRWTKKYKQQIYDSRILTTANLVDALPPDRPVTFCSTSAAGYYGDRGDVILDEESTAGDDFLARVCRDWEKEAFRAEEKGARVAAVRFGIVLEKSGGALAKMLPAYRLFLGGRLGSGRQWFPWIHLDDLIGAMQFVLNRPEIRGPVNFCAPNPVRNKDFSQTLAAVLKRPARLPVPAPLLRLAAGELGTLILNSQRVSPKKLLANGFEFAYPDVESALRSALSR